MSEDGAVKMGGRAQGGGALRGSVSVIGGGAGARGGPLDWRGGGAGCIGRG